MSKTDTSKTKMAAFDMLFAPSKRGKCLYFSVFEKKSPIIKNNEHEAHDLIYNNHIMPIS